MEKNTTQSSAEGHNGLTAAAYLAKSGRKVLVLEKRYILGGAAVTEEIFPGFKYTVYSYVVSLLPPNNHSRTAAGQTWPAYSAIRGRFHANGKWQLLRLLCR